MIKLRFINSLKAYRKRNTSWFKKDYKLFSKLSEEQHSVFELSPSFPCVKEKNTDSGVANGAYFHQDIYVARQVFYANPIKHVDVGSRIDGFVSHVAVFRKIYVYDIRPLESTIENIYFEQADFMSTYFSIENNCDSISSLHALEHFGLGRYGDPIDPLGHIKGFSNITKMLKKGGRFYFSVPLGTSRIEFNAHRIFSLKYLLDWVSRDFKVIEFSYVDDRGDIHENIELNDELINSNCDCYHGCAIFVLQKQ